jgi:hypothetical protein
VIQSGGSRVLVELTLMCSDRSIETRALYQVAGGRIAQDWVPA